MPFRTACGHQNDEAARFCNGCGQQMPEATQPTHTASTNPPPAAAPQPRQPQPAYQQPPQPHYQQQAYQPPAKDKTTATLLAWLFWPAFDFYLGNTGKGIAKLLTFGGFGFWALIDAISMLSMSQQEFDWRYNSGR